jgi:hypothetical protein
VEADILKAVAQVAGIGGIAIGTLLIVFRDIIGKKIFPTLDRQRGYQLLRLISVLTWSVALVGIAAWVWVESRPVSSNIEIPPPSSNRDITANRGVASGGDITGNTIIINAPSSPEKTEAEPSD